MLHSSTNAASARKLSFEYLHIYSPKGSDFCRKKIAKLHHKNVLSKVSFTENIEIQPERRFRNTLNIYRRRPAAPVAMHADYFQHLSDLMV